MNIKIVLTTIFLSGILSGCGPTAFVNGNYDHNINRTNLMNNRWSETDMQHTVRTLVASALRSRAIADAPRPPIVLVERLKNDTSEVIDTKSITNMIMVELSKSGRVQFINGSERKTMAAEYKYENSGTTSQFSKKNKGHQVGADLIMNGRIDSITQRVGNRESIYYKITLEMTNLSTGIIVWTDQKQIRKLFKKHSVALF